ncbi:MAG: hypothetical protein H7257_03190 [Taibaiella sp.]|nr:hypothetical protein [Taibaiella sp.]
MYSKLRHYFFPVITIILLFTGSPSLQAQDNTVPSTEAFKITGAVENELNISIKDLLTFKQENLGDITLKNKRGKVKGEARGMKGVLLKTVLDSAHVHATKPKEYSELCISLIASDNYRNVYSWNEIYNTEVGDHVYIITEMDGKPIDLMPQRILVMSLADFNSGRRRLKGLERIEVKKVQ